MQSMLEQIRNALSAEDLPESSVTGGVVNLDQMSSCFATSALAAHSVLVAGEMLASFVSGSAREDIAVEVDQRLASLWCKSSILPKGWQLPPVWDAIAGDYLAKDGWIRLHTNAAHHRAAAIRTLQCAETREAVATTVNQWCAADLEQAIVAQGGCAAAMNTLVQWQQHPQGKAIAGEPLIIWQQTAKSGAVARSATITSPLAGIRILDLTRILAGPVATRFLAAYGASVLRIDPPGLDDDGNAPELSIGKQCASLDLRTASGKKQFAILLSEADVIVHGYRPGGLDGLGFDQAARMAINPGLIDVALCAYGWSGPMAGRRGFDSLVQMSSGIAAQGMTAFSDNKPHPLPVQALDHATGYLVAATTIQALRVRRDQNRVMAAKLSLARTAHLLTGFSQDSTQAEFIDARDDEFNTTIENTAWGPARRLKFPVTLSGSKPVWHINAGPYQTAELKWPAEVACPVIS